MNAQKALGYLIAGHINYTLYAPEDDTPDGCCPVCCGPCAALVWYRDHAPDDADSAVIAIMHDPLARYEWQEFATCRIDWSLLAAVWANPCPNAEYHEEIN